MPGQLVAAFFGALTASVALHVAAGELTLSQLRYPQPSDPVPKVIEVTLLAPPPPAVISAEVAPPRSARRTRAGFRRPRRPNRKSR